MSAVASPAFTTAAVAEKAWACNTASEPRQPVLLVHGYNSGPSAWNRAAQQTLADAGTGACLVLVDYSRVATNWVTDAAIGPALAAAIVEYGTASARGGGSGKVVVVGHSMGGLALRCALSSTCGGEQATAARARVRAVVTFDTPNTGTWLRSEQPLTLGAGILGSILSTYCYLDGTLILTMQQPCGQARALTTSAATKAFTPGSKQLGALAAVNGDDDAEKIPVYATAYQTDINTTLFGHVIAHVGDAGDLIVFQDSAQSEAYKSADGIGGTLTETCPAINLDAAAAALPVVHAVNAAALVKAMSCWHGTETSDQRLLSKAATLIGELAAHDATPQTSLAPPRFVSFTTPSRNIGCYISALADQADPANEARCDIDEFDYQLPPRPDGCDGDIGAGGAFGQAITLGATGPAALLCYGDTALNDEVVPYGTTVAAGVFSCTVAETGVTCTNTATGHGFALSKRAYALQ